MNMPFLRFHAVEKEKLDSVGDKLIGGIVETLGCPRETVVLEVINSAFITGSDGVEAYPFVKVEYFERPREQQDALARVIYACMNEAGYPECDIYFSFLLKDRYYEMSKGFDI